MIAVAITILAATFSGKASAACDARQVAGRTAHVSLSVYGERPNPAWKLSEEQTAELCARLARLRSPSASEVAPPRRLIGYGGFHIDLPYNSPGIWMDQQIVVYGGLVLAFPKAWADPGRELELWLLETADAAALGNLRAGVLAEIKQGR